MVGHRGFTQGRWDLPRRSSHVAQLFSLGCMRRFTKIEIGAAVVGLAFVIIGICMLVWPAEMTMISDGAGGRYRAILGPDKAEHVSKTGSQIYGGLSVLMGVGISWLALYRGRK